MSGREASATTLSWQAKEISIGELADRSGVQPSTLRFYERRGLIESRRTEGNQRRYNREMLRRVAFIRVSQRLGVPLAVISGRLTTLPGNRTPTREDWAALAETWRVELDDRIGRLQQLRDHLSDCIGCGCLSLDRCALANPHDVHGQQGRGPNRLRYLPGGEDYRPTDEGTER